MTTITRVFCDLCGKEIVRSSWSYEIYESVVKIDISHPFLWKRTVDQVCKECCESIRDHISTLEEKRP